MLKSPKEYLVKDLINEFKRITNNTCIDISYSIEYPALSPLLFKVSLKPIKHIKVGKFMLTQEFMDDIANAVINLGWHPSLYKIIWVVYNGDHYFHIAFNGDQVLKKGDIEIF